MASGKRIIEAFASNNFKFKVTRYIRVNQFLPNYTDIKFEFIFDGQTFSGRGTDISEELAVVKGAMVLLRDVYAAFIKFTLIGWLPISKVLYFFQPIALNSIGSASK